MSYSNGNAVLLQGIPISQTPPTNGQALIYNSATGFYVPGDIGGGSGTVTTVSVVSANGFAGIVANATTTPAITLSTTITGVLKGNGTAISAATKGSDYAVGSTGLAGGQTIAGGTLTTQNLTLRANAADTTTGTIAITTSTASTTTTTGALTVAGGLGVAGAIYANNFNALTLTSVAIGFTISGGTTSKTLTVPLDASVSGTNTGDQNLSGYALLAGAAFVGAISTTSSLTLGTASSVAGTLVFKNATNAFTQTFTGSALAASRNYILPITDPTVGQVLSASAPSGADITLSWATAGGSFAWGATAAAGAGTGLTLTSDSLAGANAHISSAHTASGTLTADTTNLNTFSSSRTHTNASSVTDNFAVVSLTRTNVMNQAGGTLLAQGSILKISGTDTQTAGTLTPSYNLISLVPSVLSTGSSINLTVANSTVAPTNAHIYAVIGNTQAAGCVLARFNTGTSSNGFVAVDANSTAAVNVSWTVGFRAQSYDSSTQATGSTYGFAYNVGSNSFNSNSNYHAIGFYAINNNNAGNGYNTGIMVRNLSAEYNTSTTNDGAAGAGFYVYQEGADGTAIGVIGKSNVNASTNGLVCYALSSTQSAASVVQKINTSTSTQAHIGLQLLIANASATLRGIDFQGSTTGTGKLMSATKNSNERFKVHPWVADGASAIAYLFDTDTSLETAGAKIVSFGNAGNEKARIDKDGNYLSTGSLTTAAPTTGTAAAWKLGSYVGTGTSTFRTDAYIQLDIGGTLYKLALCTNA